jgi:hypothetical protein
MKHWQAALTGVVYGFAIVATVRGAASRSYTIDSSQSSATIEVGKAGAFSFAAGHTHEVIAPAIAGTITVDTDDPARFHDRGSLSHCCSCIRRASEPIERDRGAAPWWRSSHRTRTSSSSDDIHGAFLGSSRLPRLDITGPA